MSEAYDLMHHHESSDRELGVARHIGANMVLGAGGTTEEVIQPPSIVERFSDYCAARELDISAAGYAEQPVIEQETHAFLLDDVMQYFATRHPEIPPKLVPRSRVEDKLAVLAKQRAEAGGDAIKLGALGAAQRSYMLYADGHKRHFLEIRGLGMLREQLNKSVSPAARQALINLHTAYGMVIDELPKLW